MKIISGGQTGVDLGALDAAIELNSMGLNVSWGGTAPKDMYNEKGKIDPKYNLEEAAIAGYPFRTERNVKAAHLTLIFHKGGKIGPGSKLTAKLCDMYHKPYMHIDIDHPEFYLPLVAGIFAGAIGDYGICDLVVNIAGGRESTNPGIQQQTKDFLVKALATRVSDYPPILQKGKTMIES